MKLFKSQESLYRIGVIFAIVLMVAIPLGVGSYLAVQNTLENERQQAAEAEFFALAQREFATFYQDETAETPSFELTVEEISALEDKLANFSERYATQKSAWAAKLQDLRDFIAVRDEVLACFDGETMIPETTLDQINALKAKVDALPGNTKLPLDGKIDQLLAERQALDDQAAAARRAEEARRRAAEEAKYWVKLNVPYYSQNLSKIFNACETASLLMGLQFKGYLPGMTLEQYAEMIPKSTDPNQGFTYSIYELEPKTAPHYIAPAPLAKFGRDSSGANVQDITGASVDQIGAEITSGNPVIAYLTFQYRELKEWAEGAPLNLHVMLLTGYNTKTGAFMTTDPWTGAGGKRNYELSRAEFERLFAAVGSRAVVIR